MKRLAYLALAVELTVIGVAGWELVIPGCGGRIDIEAIRALGDWCSETPYFIVLVGSILFAVTLGSIGTLHLNAHASLLRKLFASLNFAGSLLAAAAAIILGFVAISSSAAGRSTLEFLGPLAFTSVVGITQAFIGGALLGRMRAARLTILWLGVACSICLALLATYTFNRAVNQGFSGAILAMPIAALAVLLGSSVFLLRRISSDGQPVERAFAPTGGPGIRLLQAAFVVFIIAAGARVLISEVPPPVEHVSRNLGLEFP